MGYFATNYQLMYIMSNVKNRTIWSQIGPKLVIDTHLGPTLIGQKDGLNWIYVCPIDTISDLIGPNVGLNLTHF